MGRGRRIGRSRRRYERQLRPCVRRCLCVLTRVLPMLNKRGARASNESYVGAAFGRPTLVGALLICVAAVTLRSQAQPPPTRQAQIDELVIANHILANE